MKLRPINRRTFLRGAGGVAVGLPFLDAMRGGNAFAEPAKAPKRIIFFFTGNGFPVDQWVCQASSSDPTNFALSPVLAPLGGDGGAVKSVREDCVFIEGVPMSSGTDVLQAATGHDKGASAIFTGKWAPKGPDGLPAFPDSESIDQTLAHDIGATTKFNAYYFGVIDTLPTLLARMFFAPGMPISAKADPWAVYSDLFTDLNTDPTELQKKTAEKTIVLDAVMGGLKSLQCKVGTEDKQRLEQHLAQVEEIQIKLTAGFGTNPLCGAPTLGDPMDYNAIPNIPALGKLQMDQLVMALTCDLTRIAALQWISPRGPQVFGWLGQSETHHAITHDPSPASGPKLVAIGAWYAEQFRYLIQALKNVPEGDGTLFDNTLIIWGSELGAPAYHDINDVVWTLAGSCQGAIKTGRYLKYSGTKKDNHNRLLLSLFEAMGVPKTTFGGANYCVDGPLTGLVG